MLNRIVLNAIVGAGLLVGQAGRVAAAEPFDIPVILPLTGSAAFLGAGEQLTLQRMEKQFAESGTTIGGRPIRFVFRDDQSNPQVAVQVANEVINARPKTSVVLGSTLVALCNAMAPLVRNGPVMYCFSPGIYPANDSYVFSSSVATRDLASSLIRFFRSQGWTKLAVLTSTDASGRDAQRNIKELLATPENAGIELVGESVFNPTDVSVAAQIQRLKASNPQAFIAWTSGSPVGTVFRAVSEAGWTVPVGTTDANMTHAQMSAYAAFLPAQLFIPSSPWPVDPDVRFSAEVETAKERYHSAYKGLTVQPDASGTFAWDPAELVVSALRTLGPDATAVQLRDHLAKVEGFVGVNGRYDFPRDPQRGLDEANVVITKWEPSRSLWRIVSGIRGEPLKGR